MTTPGPAKPPVRDLSTDDQRFRIFTLFEEFGIRELDQMKATARQILKLDHLPDLRELTRPDADELIAELVRAKAAGQVSGD